MLINVRALCILYFRVQVWGKELVKHGVMIKKKNTTGAGNIIFRHESVI